MRILSILLLVALSAVGIRWLFVALASDETRIEWLLEDMQAGYADGDVGNCVQGIAPEWTHTGVSDADRSYLMNGLRAKFLREMQDRTRRRMEFVEDTLVISVEGDRATVRCEGIFFQERGERPEEEVWRAALEASLERKDEGWRIVRTGHRNETGKRPR